MTRRILSLLLAGGLLTGALSGCLMEKHEYTPPEDLAVAPTTAAAELTAPTEPPATTPADGDPNDVTCKGTYTVDGDADTMVASVHFEFQTVPETAPAETTEDGETAPTEPPAPGITVVEETLTNGVLRAYYWAEVAAYRQAGHDIAPDWDKPLDTQVCPLDTSVNSWQQYFLDRALNTWSTAAALKVQGQVEGLPVEEAFQPNPEFYAQYLVDIPAVKYLYRYYPYYIPNTMHQAYLDEMPQLFEELAAQRGYASGEALAQGVFGTSLDDAVAFAQSYNWGYMYFVSMSDYIEYTEEDVTAEQPNHPAEGYTVDIRHALIVPGTETTDAIGRPIDPVSIAYNKARTLLTDWQYYSRYKNEANFAEMANANSGDTGTRLDGGGYQNLRPGQLREELDAWCFDPERKEGDTTIIETELGFHILYFARRTENSYAQAEEAVKVRLQNAILATARERYPAVIDYSAISLSTAQPEVSLSDVLYPDVAHERYPEVPLYLQRDYPNTRYGNYRVYSHGCGITTLAMLATYMADEELSPATLAERYGRYCIKTGTDGMIFNYEPSALGFYLKEKVYDPEEGRQALLDGYIVVNVQHKGHWTTGGHYLVLEKLNEDGTVQVRDSSMLNYERVPGHKLDKHDWTTIIRACDGFWIYEPKITRIPACARCGDESQRLEGLLQEDYLCRKCLPAMLRRDTYLSAS